MEQPPFPNTFSSSTSPAPLPKDTTTTTTTGKKQLPPGPEEVLGHYESQGLNTREASLKAIGELQALLYRSLASGRGKKDRFMTDSLRKLDNVNTRLAILEMKLDSKPGFPESVAIGVASGALLSGLRSALPAVLDGLGQIWGAVKSATRTSPPSSS